MRPPESRQRRSGLASVDPPTFVGRAPELAALGDALTMAPALVLVEGEAGIGKSRLVQELLASPVGLRYHGLVAACPPFREPYTLGPIVDAVRQATESVGGLPLSGLAGALRPLFPEWADDLPPAPEPLDDASAARHRLFRAIAEVLSCLDVAVLVVEDVHWADEATLEFLMFLLARRNQPLRVVLTYRPEDVPAGSLLKRLSSRVASGVTQRRLVLRPLDAAETAALVSSMLAGAEISIQFAAFLQKRTDGIPLAVEESVRLMHDRADLTRQGGSWVRRRLDHIAVPPTIRDAVLERVARLDGNTQRVLHAAAVLTEPADEMTLAALVGLPNEQVSASIGEALDCGLLRDDARGLVSFRHSLACRAVYEAIRSQQRRAMHLRAGETLERLAAPPAAQLARHFREAGHREAWCRYAEQAADRAMQSGDEAGAAVLLHNVVTGMPLPVEHLVRLVRKIQFQYLPGPDPFSGVVQVLQSALAETRLTADEEATVRFQLGRVFMVSGQLEAGRLQMRQAVARLPSDSLEAARARIFLAIPIGDPRPAAEHLSWLREAPTLAPSIASHYRLLLQADRIVALLMLGEEEGWAEAELIPAASSVPEEAGHVALAHINIGHAAMFWGRYAEARRRLAMGLELANRYPYVRDREAAAVIDVHVDWFTGSWDGLAERASVLADHDDLSSWNRCEAALVAGLLHLAKGDQERAVECLQVAVRDDQQRIEATAALAAVRLREGDIRAALDETEEPIDVVIGKGIWPQATDIVPVRLDALIAADRLDDAEGLVVAFGHVLGQRDAPSAHASLATCRAIVAQAHGEPVVAAAQFAQASAAWQGLPRPYDALRARERAAQCLLAAGRHDAGVSELSAVLRGMSELGARHDAERVAQTLRADGIDPKPRRVGRPGYGEELSPRELEVARLLVGGRTNRQIADALVLSTPTVASHLQSAMRKLGVRSRTTLALKVVELGLTERGAG